MKDYEAVIGLEVHAQLLTESKIFCSCPTTFGGEPNTQGCPVCLGMPGVLPVLNRKAVELAIKAALALNCEIQPRSRFLRKNYFYPDLPKGYQISQYQSQSEMPLATGGYIDLGVDGRGKRVRLVRVHMEEDAGKLVHYEEYVSENESLFDVNRCGVPLIEIVSEPDMRSPEEAYSYLAKLKQILEYVGVSDCNMEEGSLRCDANVSVRLRGETLLGTKTEVKNMNSFRNVQKALEAEIERQIGILEDGGEIVQETLQWDPERGAVVPMRRKEYADDYRYFPEPDLLPIEVDMEWVERLRSELPELPDARKARFVSEYGIPSYDAEVLTSTREIADYYEECVRLGADPKAASNWVMGDVLRVVRDRKDLSGFKVTPGHLAGMIRLIKDGVISGKIAKSVFEEMVKTGFPPEDVVKSKGLVQITDSDELERVVEEVLSESPNEVERYRSGRKQLFGFFMGQVMRKTRGKANPKLVGDILRRKLG